MLREAMRTRDEAQLKEALAAAQAMKLQPKRDGDVRPNKSSCS